jgi:hypothetical protein
MTTLFKASGILALSVSLAACVGGGGSSTGGGGVTPQLDSNFTQLTPNNGVAAQQVPAANAAPTTLVTDLISATTVAQNGTLYVGTNQGAIYQVHNATNGFTTLGNPIVNASQKQALASIMALGADASDYSYVTFDNRYLSQGTGFPIVATTAITAITFGDNLLSYYGTINGNVGIAQNPLANIPRLSLGCALPLPGQTSTTCTIAGLSKASSYLLDTKNTLIALQFNAVSIPAFEAEKAANRNWNTNGFSGSLSCFQSDKNEWVMIPTSNGILPQFFATFNYTDTSAKTHTVTEIVPQFITSVTANTNGKIYAATNLLDVYENTIDSNCNSGATWTKVNTAPLGSLQDGSLGVTSLNLVNGQLTAVVNNLTSIMAYKSNDKNY